MTNDKKNKKLNRQIRKVKRDNLLLHLSIIRYINKVLLYIAFDVYMNSYKQKITSEEATQIIEEINLCNNHIKDFVDTICNKRIEQLNIWR